MSDIIQWLLTGEPYVAYRTRLDLLGQPEDSKEVKQARAAMLSHPPVLSLVSDLAGWPDGVLSNHKKADLPIHKLAFLADLGLTLADPGIESITRSVRVHLSEQGVPEVLINVPTVFGGTGKDLWAWMLCDAPRLYCALRKFGVKDAALEKGIKTLAACAADNGFPCAASPKLGRFKGPGRKTDPCPYATLLMLAALLQTENTNRAELHTGAECLLHLWECSRELYPFLFHMGTDFRKLKAPFIWYDILHVADVLSQMPWLRRDPRLLDMVNTIRSKADAGGRFTPESVWLAWKAWEFGQKKQPSPWLTFLALRIFRRVGEPE